MRIRIFITLLIVAAATFLVRGQDAAELDRRNGFKTINLASPIDSVKGAVFKKNIKEKDIFEAKLYETDHPDYMTIGEARVKEIQLMTYKNLIYKIVVTTEKDPQVMVALQKSYGSPNYDIRTGRYSWSGTKLSLTVVGSKKSTQLTYRSYPVYKMMNDDKGKKVDVMAEDL